MPAETLLLARIRDHMSSNLRRQPNYTCVETIERTRRLGGTRKVQLRDTLRLEVALVEGKEMFAWPGSKNFEDKEIRELVTTGTFGTGNFAIFARSVFMTSAPVFDYRGETTLSGRAVVRFDFRVPRLTSGYNLEVSERHAVVGYHGSFYADRETMDLQRLEVAADDIPRELGLASTSERMQYSRTRIGAEDFLLPLESELVLTDLKGLESRNSVRFASCRQFSGESVLRFDDAFAADSPETVVEEVEIPADLDLSLQLREDIDLQAAAAGDAVRAELRGDLKSRKQVIAPKGAVVLGRITRLEHYADHIVLGLMFQEIEWPRWHARVKLSFDRALGFEPPVWSGRSHPVYQEHPGEGLLLLRAGRARLNRGILMFWRT